MVYKYTTQGSGYEDTEVKHQGTRTVMRTVPGKQWDRPGQGDIRRKSPAALFWCYLWVFLPPKQALVFPLHFHVSKWTTYRKHSTFLIWHLPDTLLFPWRVYQTVLGRKKEKLPALEFQYCHHMCPGSLKMVLFLTASKYLPYAQLWVVLVLRQKNLQHFPFKFEESSRNLKSKRKWEDNQLLPKNHLH